MAVAKPVLKCLVADGEPQIGSLLRDALGREGYASDVVASGDQASRKLAEGDYDLVITDLLLPAKSGVELVLEIRGRGRKTPIVLMSSDLTEEILHSCRDLEHLAFLQKPFALADLRDAVSRASAWVRC